MNRLNHIDRIFKEQLDAVDFPQKDLMWDKMENKLAAEKARHRGKKRASLALLLLVTAIVSSLIWFGIKTNSSKSTVTPETAAVPVSSKEPSAANLSAVQEIPAVNPASVPVPLPEFENQNPGNSILEEHVNDLTFAILKSKPQINIRIKPPGFFEAAEQDEISETRSISSELKEKEKEKEKEHNLVAETKTEITETVLPAHAGKTALNKVVKSQKKTFSTGFEANVDLFKKWKDVSFSAGVFAEKQLGEKVSISGGMQYAKNSLSMNYSLADKDPAIQRQIAANLHSISLVRFPVMYRQKLPGSGFTAQAGLVPSLITSAEITNVPVNFMGNPATQKVFTKKDINTFNLLFAAGMQFNVSKGVKVQATGFYGLTGLVKDGYLNRSRINDNLRSLQAGVVLKF